MSDNTWNNDAAATQRDSTAQMPQQAGLAGQGQDSASGPPLNQPVGQQPQPLAQAPIASAPPVNPAPVNPAPVNPAPVTPPSVQSSGWSALGATPARPPVASGAVAGQANYLPPVNPPHQSPPIHGAPEPVSSKPQKANTGSRWGWRAIFSFLAGGLIAASGFGAAQLSAPSETEAAATPVTEVATTATTASTAVVEPETDEGKVPLVPTDVDEPAAFVAQTLGPAVVQIDTDFGSGSGVIYKDGLILTNNHVVENARLVNITLSDGRVLEGDILGTDVNTDVAVISVGEGRDLAIAQLATGEKAQVGQIAIAIGSPFQLQQSVTAGIVSAVDRPIFNNRESVVAMIQTDAPINPGNSGGALADRQGRVIGINTSIQTDGSTNSNAGVGFAIPIDTAVRIADLLVAGEPIQAGFLGMRGAPPAGGEAGVEVTEVTVGSAAADAGLLVGDRVLSINEAPVTQFEELAGLVLANQAGDVVILQIIRDGVPLEIEATLGVRGDN